MALGAIKAGEAFIKLFLQGDEETKRKLKQLQARLAQFGQATRNLGMGMMGAGLAIGTGLGAGVKEFMDRNEAINAMNVLFGENSEIVQKWAKDFRTAVGGGPDMTMLLESANNLNQILVGVKGLSQEQALQTVPPLLERMLDVASVNNIPFAQAMVKLEGALSGSSEHFRTIAGIKIGQLNAELERMGVNVNDLDADSAEMMKTVAAMTIFMRDTDKFAGDLVNTQDELANAMRALNSEMNELKFAIGNAVAPLVELIVAGLKPMVQWVTELLEKYPALGMAIGGLAVVLTVVGGALFSFGITIAGIAAGIAILIPLVSALAGVLGAIASVVGGPLLIGLAVAAGLFRTLFFHFADGIDILKQWWGTFKETWQIFNALLAAGEPGKAWEALMLGFKIAGMQFTNAFMDAWDKLTIGMQKMMWDAVSGIVSALKWVIDSPGLQKMLEIYGMVTGHDLSGTLSGLQQKFDSSELEKDRLRRKQDREEELNELKDQQTSLMEFQEEVAEKEEETAKKQIEAQEKVASAINKVASADAIQFGTKGAFDLMFGEVELGKKQLREAKKTNENLQEIINKSLEFGVAK